MKCEQVMIWTQQHPCYPYHASAMSKLVPRYHWLSSCVISTTVLQLFVGRPILLYPVVSTIGAEVQRPRGNTEEVQNPFHHTIPRRKVGGLYFFNVLLYVIWGYINHPKKMVAEHPNKEHFLFIFAMFNRTRGCEPQFETRQGATLWTATKPPTERSTSPHTQWATGTWTCILTN